MRVIKVPSGLGGLGKGNGAAAAPDKILSQLKELYLNEEGRLPVLDVDAVALVENNFAETSQRIYAQAKEEFAKQQPLIFLGGDHSITFHLAKAFAEQHDNPGIVIFDAHPDAENDFMPPTQEDLLPALVNTGAIKPQNILLVGIRNWDKNEIAFLKHHNIKYYHMKEISEEGIKEVCHAVMSVAREFGALYISVDIDVVDPAFAPGTGYIEPAGMTSRELLFCLQKLKLLKNLKAMDIVEINPEKDVNDMTAKLGAKILFEMS